MAPNGIQTQSAQTHFQSSHNDHQEIAESGRWRGRMCRVLCGAATLGLMGLFCYGMRTAQVFCTGLLERQTGCTFSGCDPENECGWTPYIVNYVFSTFFNTAWVIGNGLIVKAISSGQKSDNQITNEDNARLAKAEADQLKLEQLNATNEANIKHIQQRLDTKRALELENKKQIKAFRCQIRERQALANQLGGVVPKGGYLLRNTNSAANSY